MLNFFLNRFRNVLQVQPDKCIVLIYEDFDNIKMSIYRIHKQGKQNNKTSKYVA